MDWMTFFSTMAGAVIGTGIFGILAGEWVAHRLTRIRDAETRASASREKQREESRAVADILAEWIRPTYAGNLSNEDRWRMQATYWKNILGLDKRLIGSLFPLLANAEGNIGTNEMIVEVRRHLLNLDKPDIKAADLNNWLPVKT